MPAASTFAPRYLPTYSVLLLRTSTQQVKIDRPQVRLNYAPTLNRDTIVKKLSWAHGQVAVSALRHFIDNDQVCYLT